MTKEEMRKASNELKRSFGGYYIKAVLCGITGLAFLNKCIRNYGIAQRHDMGATMLDAALDNDEVGELFKKDKE